MIRRFPFLTARWSNLAIITYDIDPALLTPHLPPSCAPDTIDGRAFVSLVAFDFLDTRVLGVKWPGFVQFPEINFRFYVRGPSGRGVCFIRELVAQRLVAYVARTIYNEPYQVVPMRSQVTANEGGPIRLEHFATFGNRENTVCVTGHFPTTRSPEDSAEHYFKEQSWGYGATRDGRLITYEVRHPLWDVYSNAVIETLDWDFAAVYGEKWRFLRESPPRSLVFAVGSAVSVYPKGTTAIEKTAEAIDLLHDANRDPTSTGR